MTVTLAEAVIMDVARGLGCQPDNESILLKIHEMKADYLRLRDAAQKAIRHAEKNGMSEWPCFMKLRKALESE